MNPALHPAWRPTYLHGLGTLLGLLGLTVISGWLLQVVELTRIVAPLRSMVLNTALSFLMLGVAVYRLPLARRDWSSKALPAAVLLLAGLNLLQWLLGISLGIDLPGLHAWADDGNPHPGRMAIPTSLGFLFASLSLLLCLQASALTPRRALLGRSLAAAVLALSGLSLIGYVLKLETLFGVYLLAGMALHTVLGMLLLFAGLWLSWEIKTPEFSQPASANRLLQLATWAPALIALTAGTTGILIFKSRADAALLDGLKAAEYARISQIETILSLRGTRAAIAAGRPGLQGDAESVRRELESFLPYGFSYLQLQAGDGAPYFSAGQASVARVVIRLHLHEVPARTFLVWSGEKLLLRLESDILDATGQQRRLTSEQALPAIEQLLISPAVGQQQGALQLCAPNESGIVCLHGGRRIESETLPRRPDRHLPNPIQLALGGGSGVHTFRDLDGQLYSAAYAPVGNTGLVSAFRIDTDAMNVPIRRQLVLGLLLVLIVTVTGTVLLRRRIGRQTAELLRIRDHHVLVIDSLQEGLILQDVNGRIITSNPAAARILGLTRDAMTGRTSMDPRWKTVREDGRHWPGEDHPAMRTLHSGRAETDVVMGLQRPDGSMVWISVSTAPAGRDGVVTTFSDITERRAADLRERELQNRLRLLIDGVRDYSICMLDTSGKVSSWNSGAERLSGYSGADIIGRHFSVFYPQQDLEDGKPEKALLIAEASGRYSEENWRLRKNGSRFWAHVTINSIRDDAGRLLGYAKISRDLSERRTSEQALAEASALRAGIVDCAPFSIIATDPNGTIRSINPAARRMLWYSEEDLVGKATPALIHDPEEVRRRALELSAELGETIDPGFEVFVHQSRRGIIEEREWTYIRKDGSRFPVNLAVTALRDTSGAISGFLGIAYDITERKRREEYTRHVADHDHLTGLPNRGLLKDRLEVAVKQARRNEQGVAVLMLDLDHFKRVNDSLGHHIGDQLLVAVAGRLQACLREADTVARMGGDEFVVVLPGIENAAAADTVAQTILGSISEPLTISGHELQVTPSIGISLYPRDGTSANLLLRNADVAMYSAKSAGRHEVRFFSSDIERAALQKLEMENALRRAIKREEFVLHYQPQICLRSGQVVGMEALLRWPSADGGMVPLESFIPLAEECGLILNIGSWVLRTACRQGRQLQQNLNLPLKFAVNISPRQFQQADFVVEVENALSQSGLAPECLELEITENLLMSQTEDVIARLHQIRALGVGIAIDDFGVGYSSLSYITRFPISTLKIDRCFIRRLPDSKSDVAVTQTVIDLAANLHVRVVAEGVENAEQLAFLRSRDCHEAQGSYFALGIPAERLLAQGFHFSQAVGFEQLPQTIEQIQLQATAT